MSDVRWNIYTSKKLLGLGFMLDTYPPIADKEKWFQAELKLLFIAGWVIIYKTKKK